MQVYLVLALLFSLCIAVFAVQNASQVNINLFFWQLNNISLVLVIFGSALIGALVAGLFGIVKQIKLRINANKFKTLVDEQQQQIVCLQNELEQTKQVPLTQENMPS